MRSNTISDCRVKKGREVIEYDIELSIRRSVSITIRQPDGRVVVKAPIGVSMVDVESFIKAKSEWIFKHKQRVADMSSQRITREYNNGSSHLLLGKPFKINVIESVNKKIEELSDGSLNIFLPDTTSDRVEITLKKWYLSKATNVFPSIIKQIADDFISRHNIKKMVSFQFKYVSSYWGVCTSKGVIRLNLELMRAPKECIEYILVHELCHLVHHNHSSKFYDLMSKEMPDWQDRKALLERTVSCKQ